MPNQAVTPSTASTARVEAMSKRKTTTNTTTNKHEIIQTRNISIALTISHDGIGRDVRDGSRGEGGSIVICLYYSYY